MRYNIFNFPEIKPIQVSGTVLPLYDHIMGYDRMILALRLQVYISTRPIIRIPSRELVQSLVRLSLHLRTNCTSINRSDQKFVYCVSDNCANRSNYEQLPLNYLSDMKYLGLSFQGNLSFDSLSLLDLLF